MNNLNVELFVFIWFFLVVEIFKSWWFVGICRNYYENENIMFIKIFVVGIMVDIKMYNVVF